MKKLFLKRGYIVLILFIIATGAIYLITNQNNASGRNSYDGSFFIKPWLYSNLPWKEVLGASEESPQWTMSIEYLNSDGLYEDQIPPGQFTSFLAQNTKRWRAEVIFDPPLPYPKFYEETVTPIHFVEDYYAKRFLEDYGYTGSPCDQCGQEERISIGNRYVHVWTRGSRATFVKKFDNKIQFIFVNQIYEPISVCPDTEKNEFGDCSFIQKVIYRFEMTPPLPEQTLSQLISS